MNYNNAQANNINIQNEGENNLIELAKPKDDFFGKICIHIKGNNNIIRIPYIYNIKGILDIKVFGNSSELTMEEIYIGESLSIILGKDFLVNKMPENMKIYLGNNFCIERGLIENIHSNSSTIIGKDCMCSSDVWITNSDHHPIYDSKHRIINKATSLNIGDHVWLGKNVMILKNVSIASNCIIGAGSVVAKTINKSNCAYAGNPVKLIKRNVLWDYKDENFV